MISQYVKHARVRNWDSDVVCLFFEAIKARDHFTRIAPGAPSGRDLILQKPQFSVHT